MSTTNAAQRQRDDSVEPAPTGSVEPPRLALGWLEFANYLVRKGAVTGDLLGEAGSADGPERRVRLNDLWELTDLSANDFAHEVASFFKLPRLSLPELLAASSLAPRFSARFLRETTAFPCEVEAGTSPTLVLADPTDAATVRAAQIVLRGPVMVAVASFEDIATVLSKRLDQAETPAPELGEPLVLESEDDIENLQDLASGAPVVRAVNDLLERAVELRATDIHVEPVRGGMQLRLRVDGLLRSVPTPARVLPQAFISRIKILAGLNIAERRLPQDGAAHLRIARSDVDLRVATMPTQFGEAAAIRLLPKDRGVLDISKLGLSAPDEVRLKRILGLPHGMIVVTGPTGSGKTTTLATMLTLLNDSTRKILSIEDPIEYEIRGVNQSQAKPEIGLTFASALRAFVRQDPDVIMVGEVRDSETAHIAVHAALTGHLVLTTLHTETAAAAVPRLLDLGVEPFLLQSTLRAVIAQRLVRMLCDRCKTERRLTATDVTDDPRYAVLGLRAEEIVRESSSCDHCGGTGYRGRTGLFEMLETGNELRQLIGDRTGSEIITRVAKRAGMTTMFEHGVAKCRAGVTSASEVLRVTTIE